ncbi:MAG: hypothetical protein K1X88_11465 [Nannocystaceae bacterium]|nr:hypothetical protein [Nannocystaceae bacterium]
MTRRLRSTAITITALLGGCAEPFDADPDAETEIITTVRLTFTPEGGGAAITAAFTDPDGDGGMPGNAEPIALLASGAFTLAVEFANALEQPEADITAEVREEAQDHQVFLLGTAVRGPATGTDAAAPLLHAYDDVESDYGENTGDDLPVGLVNRITVQAAGTGTLTVLLRHMPPQGGTPQKVAGLAEGLAAGEPLPGEVDAQVDFMVTVQ